MTFPQAEKLMSRTRIAFQRLVIALAILLVSTGSAEATTIVVVRTTTEIVIAADSKVTDAYGESLDDSCKIRQVGNLFIGFEGFVRDKKTGFNVPEIARQALQLKPNASPQEKVGVLTGFITSALFDELIKVRSHSPDVFQIKLLGRTFLRLVIAGFDKNRPVDFVRQFRMTPIAGKFAVTVVPDDCLDDCKGEVVTRFLGETAAIDGLPEDTPDFWREGLVVGARRLVEMQIMARSEYVGPPIDILQISAKGGKWVQKKSACREVQPTGLPVRPGRRRRR